MSEIAAPTAPPLQPAAKPAAPGTDAPEASLRKAARDFEAAFLAEMLRHSGLGRMPDSFNGGAGESAFAGTLVEAYAKRIAADGGLGLAEQIYRSLAARGAE